MRTNIIFSESPEPEFNNQTFLPPAMGRERNLHVVQSLVQSSHHRRHSTLHTNFLQLWNTLRPEEKVQ